MTITRRLSISARKKRTFFKKGKSRLFVNASDRRKQNTKSHIRETYTPCLTAYTPLAPDYAPDNLIYRSELSPLFFSNSTHQQSLQTNNPDSHPVIHSFNCENTLDMISNQLINHMGKAPFKNVLVVAMQHILDTTVDMFKVFKKLGLERAIIGGKSYSTHKESIQELIQLGYTFIEAPDQLGYGSYEGCMSETVNNIWNTATEAMQKKPAELLLILDDGGNLILSTSAKWFNGISYKPKRIIGIEQTRGGSNHRCFNGVPFPIINVAGSYVKTTIEYPMVAEIVAAKTTQRIQKKSDLMFAHKPIIGVVGNGTMGKAVVNQFRSLGYRVLVHDDKSYKNDERTVDWRPNILTLICDADIIIGCTGTDITAGVYTLSTILSSIKPKCFVSTSSKDIEFNSLLGFIQEQTKELGKTPDPFANIEYINPAEPNSQKITILRGGFPINFDNQKHSVPPEKIWVTRAALLSACLMAVRGYNEQLLNTADVLQLDAHAQELILNMFEKMNPNHPLLQKTKGLTAEGLRQVISKQSDGKELTVFTDQNEFHNLTRCTSPLNRL